MNSEAVVIIIDGNLTQFRNALETLQHQIQVTSLTATTAANDFEITSHRREAECEYVRLADLPSEITPTVPRPDRGPRQKGRRGRLSR